MPLDPNLDPRKTMSSGGPAPGTANTPPPPPPPPPNPLFGDGTGGIGAGAGGPGAATSQIGAPVNIGYGPGEMQPGDHTGGFFGGIVHDFVNSGILGDGPAGTLGTAFDQVNRNLPGEALQTIGSLGGGGGGAGTPASLGGAPVIPGVDTPGGPGGGVGTLQGLDMTQPGALEAYQKQMGGYFGQPTLSEMFAKGAMAQGPGAAPTNRAEEAYQQFNGSSPADMSPYYDNERRKAEEAIRKTMAARGSYGSSAADDLYNEAYTNLAADAAKANAQYGLQRGQLLGSLAQGADSSSLAGSGDRRNWMSALGALAGQGDNAGLSRVIAGGNLAGAAQGAQRTRGQDAFNNQLSMGDRLSGILGQGYGGIFGSDADLFKTGVGLNTGTATEGYNQAAGAAAQNRTDVGNFNNLLGGNLTLGRGLVDMFQQGSGPPPPSPMPAPAGYAGPPPDQNYGTSNYYFPGRP